MKSIEGNFDNSEVNDLLKKHFIELRSVSPAGSTHVLDICLLYTSPSQRDGVLSRGPGGG